MICKVTAKTKNGTLVGVYSTKAHPLSNLDFSLDIAVRSIEFYEDYYGVKYPILNHFTSPFLTSQQVLWKTGGLVTYREVYLVVDENSTFASRQQLPLLWHMSWLTNGLVTSWLWNGGMIFGLMKASQTWWNTSVWMPSSQVGISLKTSKQVEFQRRLNVTRRWRSVCPCRSQTPRWNQYALWWRYRLC